MSNAILNNDKNTKKMTTRPVKYNSEDEEVMTRFIFMQFPLCKDALVDKNSQKQSQAIKGAVDYISREVAHERPALKTKFNKLLKMKGLPTTPNSLCVGRDSGDSLKRQARNPDNVSVLIPLSERSFVEEALNDMLTSYQKAQNVRRATCESSLFGEIQTSISQESSLGKRHLDYESSPCYPPYKNDKPVHFGDDHHGESDHLFSQILGLDSIVGSNIQALHNSVRSEPILREVYLEFNRGYQGDQITANMYNEGVDQRATNANTEEHHSLMFMDDYECLSSESFELSNLCK